MNFLDQIWLIPLFPLFGALLMLLFGKLLDPQPGGGEHPHSPLKFLVSILCPGMVLLSFVFSAGAVWQLSQLPNRVHEVIQFTWIAGLPFHMASGQMATFQADWGFLLDPQIGRAHV